MENQAVSHTALLLLAFSHLYKYVHYTFGNICIQAASKSDAVSVSTVSVDIVGEQGDTRPESSLPDSEVSSVNDVSMSQDDSREGRLSISISSDLHPGMYIVRGQGHITFNNRVRVSLGQG